MRGNAICARIIARERKILLWKQGKLKTKKFYKECLNAH